MSGAPDSSGTGGWRGASLAVDLSSGACERSTPAETDLLRFLGGRGLAVLEVVRRVPPGTEPLGPANVLAVAAGPLTGTPVPTSGRFSLAAKSPLTGTVFDSSCGGGFGRGLKGAGFDSLVITGRAAEPVCLVITPEGAGIEKAGDLWGRDTRETSRLIAGRWGKKAEQVSIGPAGEHLVPLAGARSSNRSLGRGGLGAVMGSKNLKAIVALGGEPTPVADPERLKFVIHEMTKWLTAHPMTARGLPAFGTAVLTGIISRMGMFPARNFTRIVGTEASAVSGEEAAQRLTVRRVACRGCPVGCGRVSRVMGRLTEGPEYESIWALGPECGIMDLEWIAEANDRCNRLGLDTISTGVTIGCAMELSERGILENGPVFGRKEGLLELIEGMALGKGPGRELSRGSLALARGLGAEETAMQVKGLELPAYDPRGAQGLALGFATSNRGGCHLRSYMVAPEVLGIPRLVDRRRPEGKAGLTIVLQNSNAAMDSLALCRFMSFALSDEYYARALAAVTGVPFRTNDLQIIGERIWTLERLFNLKEGFTACDDRLPARFLEEPISEGAAQGEVVRLAPMLKEYYRFRDYGADGVPRARLLEKLNLEEFNAS